MSWDFFEIGEPNNQKKQESETGKEIGVIEPLVSTIFFHLRVLCFDRKTKDCFVASCHILSQAMDKPLLIFLQMVEKDQIKELCQEFKRERRTITLLNYIFVTQNYKLSFVVS